MEPCGTHVESLQSFVEPCETSGPTALAESCGTLKPSYNLTSNHRGPPRSPCRTSWDPVRTVLDWNLTLHNLVEFWWNSHGTLPQTSPDRWWNSGETLVEPSWNLRRTTPHPRRNGLHDGLVEPWRKPGGTLVEPNLKPPRTTLQPLQNLVKPWQNSGANLVEPSWNLPQTRPPQPSKKLLEPWWNPRGTLPATYLQTTQTTPQRGTLVEPWRDLRETFLKPGTLVEPSWEHPALAEPWWNPGGTLVEPYLKPPQNTPPLQNLVEPSWNPRGNHPRTPRPCRTWWNPGGTLVEPYLKPRTPRNPGGALVEPRWNPGGTLAQIRPEPPRSLSGLRPQSFQLLGKSTIQGEHR